jgi:dephospho-CoA kinase
VGLVIGITGQSGAGKSVVSDMLRARGFPVIDADSVARKVTRKGEPCLVDLALEFGIVILDSNGSLDRRRLGKLVFGQPEKLARLNDITHPYIIDEIKRETRRFLQKGERAVFLDAPTLFESGADTLCDKIVAVVAPKSVRIKRIKERDSLSDDEARARAASQQKREYYAAKSNILIVNKSDISGLRVTVMEMLENLGLALSRLEPKEASDGEKTRHYF